MFFVIVFAAGGIVAILSLPPALREPAGWAFTFIFALLIGAADKEGRQS